MEVTGRWGVLSPYLGAVLAALCIVCTPVVAQEPEPGFIVRTAVTDLVDGVHYLSADIDYGLGDTALEALENGVPLTFGVEVVVIRERRWLWDQTAFEINKLYEITFHPLAEQFVVRDLNDGTQASYLSFRAAAAELGRISDMPIVADAELVPDARYQVRMRVRLVVEAFPAPLRWVAMMFERWRLTSDWYAWTLRS
jgi:hypothetical protein